MGLFETHTFYRDKNNVLRSRRDVVSADSDREAREKAEKKVKSLGTFDKTYLNKKK